MEISGTGLRDNRSRHRQSAVTLIEVLVAMGIFSVILTLVVVLFVNGYHTYSGESVKTYRFRRSAIALDAACRELRHVERIYSPDISLLSQNEGYAPVKGKTPPFTFVEHDPSSGAEAVVAYSTDKASHALVRMLYDPQYDPNDASTQRIVAQKNMAQSVNDLTLRIVNAPSAAGLNIQFMEIRLSTLGEKTSFELRSKVRMGGSF